MRQDLGGIGGVEERTSGVLVDGSEDSILAIGRRDVILLTKDSVSCSMPDPAWIQNLGEGP